MISLWANQTLLFNSQAEGLGPLRQAIIYDYNYKTNEKQVKETVPTCSQNWLLPVTLGDQKGKGHFRLGD